LQKKKKNTHEAVSCSKKTYAGGAALVVKTKQKIKQKKSKKTTKTKEGLKKMPSKTKKHTHKSNQTH